MSEQELLDLPICESCGTQFGVVVNSNSSRSTSSHSRAQSQSLSRTLSQSSQSQSQSQSQSEECRICADPRQYIQPTGSTYTTLRTLQTTHRNRITRLIANPNSPLTPTPGDPKVFTITTHPPFAIGQRAFFIKTPHGNILWDLVALLDDYTKWFIESHGGLAAVVISHPHYYTTHAYWASVFGCPVYVAIEDRVWLSHDIDATDIYEWITSGTRLIVPGVIAIKVGGHFDGSLCLHVQEHEPRTNRLYISDSLVTVPSANGPFTHPPNGVSSYAFMWSIPNMIPITPKAIRGICDALQPFEFESTHGAFKGQDVSGTNVKRRIMDSARIAVTAMGWDVDVVFAGLQLDSGKY